MTRDEVYALLPEMMWIEDQPLREKCADVWVEALEESGWLKHGLDKMPIVIKGLPLDCPDNNNLKHTRAVARMSVKIYDESAEFYPEAGVCERDVIIAGALLHDVGKHFEYAYVDGQAVAATESVPGAQMFTHPYIGAQLIRKHGLPSKVEHAVLAHSDMMSPGGSAAYQTRESLIVKYADCLCFFYLLKHYGS